MHTLKKVKNLPLKIGSEMIITRAAYLPEILDQSSILCYLLSSKLGRCERMYGTTYGISGISDLTWILYHKGTWHYLQNTASVSDPYLDTVPWRIWCTPSFPQRQIHSIVSHTEYCINREAGANLHFL